MTEGPRVFFKIKFCHSINCLVELVTAQSAEMNLFLSVPDVFRLSPVQPARGFADRFTAQVLFALRVPGLAASRQWFSRVLLVMQPVNCLQKKSKPDRLTVDERKFPKLYRTSSVYGSDGPISRDPLCQVVSAFATRDKMLRGDRSPPHRRCCLHVSLAFNLSRGILEVPGCLRSAT